MVPLDYIPVLFLFDVRKVFSCMISRFGFFSILMRPVVVALLAQS